MKAKVRRIRYGKLGFMWVVEHRCASLVNALLYTREWADAFTYAHGHAGDCEGGGSAWR